MTITLDESKFISKQAAHSYLKAALALPEWYGANLDALHDALSEISEDTLLIVPKSIAAENRLGSYGETMLTVFQDSSQENPFLSVRFIP
ncbi:MAG: barstar family protein [Dialister sp.]|nr:barstar family protein [Dialister sp.]